MSENEEAAHQTVYAVSYARVSTDDKDQNPESQLKKIREWAKARHVTIINEYQDESTGTNMNRKGLMDLIGYLNVNYQIQIPGKVTMMIALDTDRVSRNQKDMPKILEMLDKVGVKLVYVAHEGLDLTTSQGYLINSINSFGAQSYTDGHSLKVKAGMERAKAQGKHIGRPMKRRDGALDVTLIMEAAKQGISLRRMEDIFHVSRNTIVRRLKEDGRYDEFKEIQQNHKETKIPNDGDN